MSRRQLFMTVSCCLCVAPALTAAQTRVDVQDARTLLVAAIDAPDGRAQGILTGDLAQAITQRFQGRSPINIDVITLKRYAQPGCRRLQVTFWQDGVVLPGAPAPRRQTVAFGLNYCRDGQPPRSLS